MSSNPVEQVERLAAKVSAARDRERERRQKKAAWMDEHLPGFLDFLRELKAKQMVDPEFEPCIYLDGKPVDRFTREYHQRTGEPLPGELKVVGHVHGIAIVSKE